VISSVPQIEMSTSNTLLIFSCLILGAIGLPKQDENYAYYNEQEYKDDYDYGEDEVPVHDADGASDNSVPIHRPAIISESIEEKVDNGMTIRLPCIVDKLPGAIPIIWSKEDGKKTIIAMGTIISDPEYKERATVTVNEKGSTLTIGIANTEDAGQYKCSVAVQNPPEVKHTVKIRASPIKETSTPTILKVLKGDDVSLNCKVSGSPSPKVIWSRNDKTMPDGSEYIDSEILVFSDVTRKHAGIYSCLASNGNGKEVSKQIEVVVEYAPEMEVTEVFVHTKTGDKAEMVCLVHAYPPPTVVWSKDDQPLKSSGRIQIVKSGRRLSVIVNDVKKVDFGKYTCKASNSLGSDKKILKMTGHATPADFKSAASGHSETSFLIEWTSRSFTQIEEFLLEVRPSHASSEWQKYKITPSDEGPYQYAGKEFLGNLTSATPYSARVTARNAEGWGSPSKVWNFATKGAEPFPLSATGSATSTSLSLISFLLIVLYEIPMK